MSRVIAGNNVFVSSKGKYSKLSMDSGERNRLYHHIAPKIAKGGLNNSELSFCYNAFPNISSLWSRYAYKRKKKVGM